MTRAVFAVIAGVAFLFGLATAAHAGTLPNISGTWYVNGDHSKRAHITQSGTSITLRNERGQTATGSFLDPSHITTIWSPSIYTPMAPRTQIEGRITRSLNTIHWSNGTRWTRCSS